jgi:hypothetical protein
MRCSVWENCPKSGERGVCRGASWGSLVAVEAEFTSAGDRGSYTWCCSWEGHARKGCVVGSPRLPVERAGPAKPLPA